MPGFCKDPLQRKWKEMLIKTLGMVKRYVYIFSFYESSGCPKVNFGALKNNQISIAKFPILLTRSFMGIL